MHFYQKSIENVLKTLNFDLCTHIHMKRKKKTFKTEIKMFNQQKNYIFRHHIKRIQSPKINSNL